MAIDVDHCKVVRGEAYRPGGNAWARSRRALHSATCSYARRGVWPPVGEARIEVTLVDHAEFGGLCCGLPRLSSDSTSGYSSAVNS